MIEFLVLFAVLVLLAAVSLSSLVERARQLPRPMTCDEARELAAKLHASAAWHCGCQACSSWRRAMEVSRG